MAYLKTIIIACCLNLFFIIAASEFEMHPVYGKIPAQGTIARDVWELNNRVRDIGPLRSDLNHLERELSKKIDDLAKKVQINEDRLKIIEKRHTEQYTQPSGQVSGLAVPKK